MGAPSLKVTIVSDNPETLDGLEAYLRRAGISTRATRRLEASLDIAPPSLSVWVVFPDDFDKAAVLGMLGRLRSMNPSALAVVVTKDPTHYETLSPDAAAPLVLPKPAWGWTILDAIRSKLPAPADDTPRQKTERGRLRR